MIELKSFLQAISDILSLLDWVLFGLWLGRQVGHLISTNSLEDIDVTEKGKSWRKLFDQEYVHFQAVKVLFIYNQKLAHLHTANGGISPAPWFNFCQTLNSFLDFTL